MPAFQYRALTQVGEVVRGSPDASSLVEVNRRVEHGLIAIEAAIATSEAASHNERLNKRTGSPAGLARCARRAESREGEAGFTLVEMLVVITIIGLVMALVGPRVLSYLGNSKVKAAKIQIEKLLGRTRPLLPRQRRLSDRQRKPDSACSASVICSRLERALPRTGSAPDDPWGHPYVYKVPGDHAPYEIASYGAGTAGNSQSMIKSASR